MKMLDNNIAIKINNKKPSVCFLAPYALPVLSNLTHGSGGAERQFVLFGRFLSKRGWNVSYIVDNPLKKVAASKIFTWCQVYAANFSYLGGSNWNIFSGILSLYNAMLYSKADIFIVKTQAFLLLPMSFLARLLRKKIVFWAQLDRDCRRVREQVPKILSWAQNQGMKAAELFITQSQSQASELKANFGYDATIIPSIASTLEDAGSDDFTREDPNSTRLVLWCGNSGQHKRYEVFLNLARMMPDASFIMAQGIGDATRYKKAEEEAGRIPNLRFLGSVPPRQMENWFFKSALYINTSTFEGFPNTYIQSWQAGIPVVSLNIDPDDVLSKNQMGVVLGKQILGMDPWDFYSLATSLVPVVSRLLDNPELRIIMGERAQKYVRQFHHESVVGPTLETLLLSILN